MEERGAFPFQFWSLALIILKNALLIQMGNFNIVYTLMPNFPVLEQLILAKCDLTFPLSLTLHFTAFLHINLSDFKEPHSSLVSALRIVRNVSLIL